MVDLPIVGRSRVAVVRLVAVFRIGPFATLTGVAAKRLRHYDTRGLFRPAWVDPDNGYRYYSATQIPELRRIVGLLELGIPIGRILELQSGATSLADELAERQEALRAEQRRVERRLRELEIRLDRHDDIDVVVRRRPRRRWASLRTEVRGDDLSPFFVEVERWVARHEARAAWAPACVVHGSDPPEHDVEVLVPLDRDIPSTDRIKNTVTPSRLVASTLVSGGYSRLGPTVDSLREWARAARRRVVGPPTYVYLSFSAEPELELPEEYLAEARDRLLTEIQLPVRT